MVPINNHEEEYDLDQVVYANFWIRFLASIIDNAIFATIFCIGILIFYNGIFPQFLPVPIIFLLGYLFCIVNGRLIWYMYFLYFLVLTSYNLTGLLIFGAFFSLGYFLYFLLMNSLIGATLGKLATSLRIRKADNLNEISFGKALGRFFALEYISPFPFNLGFLWAAWDPQKQTWHDKLARTIVVYKDTIVHPLPPPPEPTSIEIPMTGREFGEIVFIAGTNKGKARKMLGEKVIIGRSDTSKPHSAHIAFEDLEKMVSRPHCEVFVKDKRYYIRNLSSSKPTILNGRQIRQEEYLRNGDKIKLGNHEMKILLF